MKSNNPPRDLGAKNVTGATQATTPVSYRSAGAVYRSLAAVPTPLEVQHQPRNEKPFATLVGPQTNNKGEVVWAESKSTHPVGKEHQPLPIPLIVAHASHNTAYIECPSVSKLVDVVHVLFEQHQVDFDYKEAKFKWKCACYADHVETTFVSKLFRIPDKPDSFILDFQRRSGDPFHFQSLYKALCFKLLTMGFATPCLEQKPQVEPQMKSFRPIALPDDFFGADECVEEKSSNDFEPLCKMCTSPYIDVQREGLLALSHQLEQDESARRCLSFFAEKLVEIMQLSRDGQVKRLAVSAIAALSSENSAHASIKSKSGLLVLAKTVTDDLEVLETRRLAARALGNVHDWDMETKIKLKGSTIAKDARLMELLKNLQSRVN